MTIAPDKELRHLLNEECTICGKRLSENDEETTQIDFEKRNGEWANSISDKRLNANFRANPTAKKTVRQRRTVSVSGGLPREPADETEPDFRAKKRR